MKWLAGLVEYEIKCKWCPSYEFTHLPIYDAWQCDGCAKRYPADQLLKRTTLYAIDLDGNKRKLK